METTGLGVAPSGLARFTVGMVTQKVDSVVTIWLMPSMMAFARLPIASSITPETAAPRYAIKVPDSHSAMSDPGPGDESAQSHGAWRRSFQIGRQSAICHFPVPVLPTAE